MREAEVLYLFVVALFVYECLITVPIDGAVMQRRVRRWRRVSPLVLRSGAGPAIVFAWPLPALGQLAIGRRNPGGRLAMAEVQPRLAAHLALTRDLRLCENLLFIITFGGGAALVWVDQIPAVPVLVAIGAGWVATAFAAVMVQRRMPPKARPAWKDVIVAFASPLSALRLHDIFAKPVLRDLDELALIAALAAPEDRNAPFREALARARYLGHGDPEAITALAIEAGLDVAALRAPPVREGPEALAFCPVCHAQFLRLEATCEGCADLRPLAFDADISA